MHLGRKIELHKQTDSVTRLGHRITGVDLDRNVLARSLQLGLRSYVDAKVSSQNRTSGKSVPGNSFQSTSRLRSHFRR